MVYVKVVNGGHIMILAVARASTSRPVVVATLQGVNTVNENLKILILIHYKS